ncbi:hypothetical protein [Leisingera daeponensis]|uniref:hypothetical protein n=1 Tax=Leisingera daeponensis TaxID=405746 RepID=UPI0021BD02A6|nr:hypothetical protein [Leisingera daeponensis]
MKGWHPVFPWAAFLLLGMWAGRRQLTSRRVPIHLVIWGTAAAILAALPGILVQDFDPAELIGFNAIPPGSFYLTTVSGSALTATGVVLAISPALEKAGLAEWLAAPGRHSLSLYALHILLGMGTLEAMG